MLIIAILAFGMLVGWLAQLALGQGGRPDAESLGVGIVGSFVGGLLVSLLSGDGLALKPSGLIGSFVGAVIVLAAWRALTRGRRQPAPRPARRKPARRRSHR